MSADSIRSSTTDDAIVEAVARTLYDLSFNNEFDRLIEDDRSPDKRWEDAKRWYEAAPATFIRQARAFEEARAVLAAVAPLIRAQERERDASWCMDMSLAPKDGTKVDLVFPPPRGRTIDCFWDESPIFGAGWFWRNPRWVSGALLSESEWQRNYYPNIQPIAWRLAPALPPAIRTGGAAHDAMPEERS